MARVETDLASDRDAVQRLLRDVAVVDSVAAILVDAQRVMKEARFLLRDQYSAAPETIFSRCRDAAAVLDAGISSIDEAISEDDE